METTKNPLTKTQEQFLSTLGSYVGSRFYYFGSIQRSDYIIGESDIDIDIFSYQPEKMARRLLHLLNGPYVSMKRVWWSFDGNEINGYKIKYKRPASLENNISEKIKIEFSIYNEDVKDLVLEKHRKQIFISPYLSSILLFVKWIFRKSWIYYLIKKQLLSRNDTFVSIPY
jgi:hypothetical protein